MNIRFFVAPASTYFFISEIKQFDESGLLSETGKS